MKIGVLACVVVLFVMSAPVKADQSLVFRAESPDGTPAVLRIFLQKPCTNESVLMFLATKFGAPPTIIAQFKAAILTWQGKDWASCWFEQRGRVYSVDEEGAQFQPIPKPLMRREEI